MANRVGTERCLNCKGSGKIDCPICDGWGETQNGHDRVACRACGRSGNVVCHTCSGSGKVLVSADRLSAARGAVEAPTELLSQLAPGTRLVPEAHRCPLCNPNIFHTPEKDCATCGGRGKVLGWRVERS